MPNELTQTALKKSSHMCLQKISILGYPISPLHDIPANRFLIDDIPVTPIQVWHMRMPVLGFRFGDFTYITDANRIDEEEKKDPRQQDPCIECTAERKAYFPFQPAGSDRAGAGTTGAGSILYPYQPPVRHTRRDQQ